MYTSAFVKELEQVPQEVFDLTLKIGMPQGLLGYNLSVIAVAKIMREPMYGMNITSQLYPWLGELVQASSSAIERRIRHAVEATITKLPFDVQAEIFGANIDARTGSISNANFLCLLANTAKRTMMESRADQSAMMSVYPNDMYALRERLINNMLAEKDTMFEHMLNLYRLNGGMY